MKAFYLTDAGRIRDHNEDSVTILKNLNNEYLMIVADGMGGHRAGEVASSLAVAHLGKRFTETASVGSKLDAVNWLKDNINEINKAIIDYTKDYLIFGNIGDSVGYVVKNNKLHKVTKEHTLVNLLVSTGELTEEEAKNHPKRNVLMKALGAAEVCELDIFDVDTDVDGIMLCSDGLTNMLTVEQIERVLNDEELNIEQKVVKLIRKSNARGGTDNITIAYLVNESEDTL